MHSLFTFFCSFIMCLGVVGSVLGRDADVFRDDFDGKSPVTWEQAFYDGSTFRPVGPQVVETGNFEMSADSNTSVVAWYDQADAEDTSFRARLNITEVTGSFALPYLFVRSPDNRSYFGGIYDDGRLWLGESFVDLSGQAATSQTELRPLEHDVVLQLDAVGNRISLTAWPGGHPKPSEAQMEFFDDTIVAGTFGFAFRADDHATVEYRWAASVPVPEPNCLSMTIVAFCVLTCSRRRRPLAVAPVR